jgi:Flp pilus assembly CpaE family ATPase
MIKTRTVMMLRNIKELLQQLRAKNSAIVTLTAIISRMEAPSILEIVG